MIASCGHARILISKIEEEEAEGKRGGRRAYREPGDEGEAVNIVKRRWNYKIALCAKHSCTLIHRRALVILSMFTSYCLDCGRERWGCLKLPPAPPPHPAPTTSQRCVGLLDL